MGRPTSALMMTREALLLVYPVALGTQGEESGVYRNSQYGGDCYALLFLGCVGSIFTATGGLPSVHHPFAATKPLFCVRILYIAWHDLT